MFAAYRQYVLFFIGIAVRVAVQGLLTQQCLRNEWKQESDDHSPKEQVACCAVY